MRPRPVALRHLAPVDQNGEGTFCAAIYARRTAPKASPRRVSRKRPSPRALQMERQWLGRGRGRGLLRGASYRASAARLQVAIEARQNQRWVLSVPRVMRLGIAITDMLVTDIFCDSPCCGFVLLGDRIVALNGVAMHDQVTFMAAYRGLEGPYWITFLAPTGGAPMPFPDVVVLPGTESAEQRNAWEVADYGDPQAEFVPAPDSPPEAAQAHRQEVAAMDDAASRPADGPVRELASRGGEGWELGPYSSDTGGPPDLGEAAPVRAAGPADDARRSCADRLPTVDELVALSDIRTCGPQTSEAGSPHSSMQDAFLDGPIITELQRGCHAIADHNRLAVWAVRRRQR